MDLCGGLGYKFQQYLTCALTKRLRSWCWTAWIQRDKQEVSASGDGKRLNVFIFRLQYLASHASRGLVSIFSISVLKEVAYPTHRVQTPTQCRKTLRLITR